MARPIKEGLDYFPFDVDFFSDIKVRRIIKGCGPASGTILICLLCNIYRDGYYILWNEDMPFVIADTIGVAEGAVMEVVQKALQVGFFDDDMYQNHMILTSRGVQKRYLDAKRNRILNPVFDVITRVIAEETPVIDAETPVNTGESAQRKEKKSKAKESKEKYIVDYLNQKTGKSFRPSSKSTQSHISARLKEGFTVEDFVKVIDKKTADWLIDPKMSEYLRPETLFGTKFESYLNQSGKHMGTKSTDSGIDDPKNYENAGW